MSASLLVLVGDHALRAPRVATSPLVRLACGLNGRGGSSWVVEDLSSPSGTREIVREALSRLADRGPVGSRYEQAVVVVSLSVGDLRSGGLHPSSWRANVAALVRCSRALGYAVALLHVAYPEDGGTKDARRWSKRLGPEVERLVVEEGLLGSLTLSTTGWTDLLDPGEVGVEAVSRAVFALLDVEPPPDEARAPEVSVIVRSRR